MNQLDESGTNNVYPKTNNQIEDMYEFNISLLNCVTSYRILCAESKQINCKL